jgi:hypothetical protein
MPNVADHLKASFSGRSLDEALQLPVSALLGVTDGAAEALKKIGVETIFDLGSSWLFANASAAIEPATGAPGFSTTHLLEDLPAIPDDAGSLPVDSLRGISDADAAAIKQALGLETIREFALWPPRRVAQGLLSEASSASADPDEAHAEALRPKLGEYPTERVYYNSLVMLGMAASASQQPLTGTISLQPAVENPGGFGRPAIGALVTMAQSWFAKGITLGHMLHSLALAPGEATRIAVVDWSRRSRAATSETIEESELLDTATDHSRAISEVQNAVANEMQQGESMSSGWAKSTSKGKGSGASVGGGIAGVVKGVAGVLGFGAGTASSRQESETTTEAASSSWSIGSRTVMAEMAQHVNDRTEQHSTSVRNRRASAVREVSQSEHEQVSTRVVANYNHMHALTVQYYEVVQIYRVLVQVHAVQRVLFLPFELLDFSGPRAPEVVARFRAQLLAAALTERVAALLIDDRGEVEIRSATRIPMPPIFSDFIRDRLAGTATLARTTLGDGLGTTPTPTPTPTPPTTTPPTTTPTGTPVPGGVLTAPAPAFVRRFTVPGPILDTVPGDAELVSVAFDSIRVDRVRLDQSGISADSSTFAVPDATFKVDFPAGTQLRSITAIHVTKMDADADEGTMTLHYRSANRQLTLVVPLDLPPGTAMQKVAYLASDPSNRRDELMGHLQSNRAYYSQAVLQNLDSATLAMLLSRFTFKGKPLADQVEPNPLAVAGNFLVLRAPIEENEVAGLDNSNTTWGELLRQRSMTFDQRDDRLVPIPTGGVFAEAVLGRSNSAEKLDITRFWNWQDSPIPLQPPEIAPVSVGSRATAEDLRPGQLSAPVLNITTPTALPEPAGLTAALNTLANGSMFRDMSGLAGTQALAQAGSAGTLDAATEAGRLASANLKTVTDQATAMGQAAADMWKARLAKGGSGDGSGGARGSGSNISSDGARINHGRDLDKRGVSGSDGTLAKAGSGGFKVTESQAEFQAAGSAESNAGSAPFSRELAAFDTSTTGISNPQVAGTVNALGGGAIASNLAIGVGSIPLAGVVMALDTMVLKQVESDVQLSGASLQGITLHAMRRHPQGDRFSLLFDAWTNSSTDIFFNTDDFLQTVANNSGDDRFARAGAVIAIRHELVHIDQFRNANGPPQNFKEMLSHELDAYGCPTPATSTKPVSKWLNDTTQNGARHFFVTKLKIDPVDATTIINDALAGFTTSCGVLSPLQNLTTSAADLQTIKDAFTANKFLPVELKSGKGYAIGELYKLKRRP